MDGRPVRSFDVRVNTVRGSTILTRGTQVYELREVESLIWNLCDGEHTMADIALAVAAEFCVDRQEALHDAQKFVDDLRQEKLVEVDGG